MAESNYEYVNHPPHYNNYRYETVEMIRRIYGDEEAAMWCELNAFKYRMRLGLKPNTPIEQDLEKEKWYLAKKDEILKNISKNPTPQEKELLFG